MREIKFRQWMRNRFHYMEFVNKRYFTGPESLNLDMCPLEQFTGLRDKNGREIYEGDILHCGIHPMYIEWNEEFGQWYASDMDNAYHTPLWICLHGNNAVLTGNIHENPELLEANK